MLVSAPNSVHVSVFCPTHGIASNFLREMSFLHNLNDLSPYNATGIQTHVRE